MRVMSSLARFCSSGVLMISPIVASSAGYVFSEKVREILRMRSACYQWDDFTTLGPRDSLNWALRGATTNCDRADASVVLQFFVEGGAG